jgi:cytochrome c5
MSIEHENFIKTPKQLIIIGALAFLVPIAIIALLSQLMTSDKKVRPGENPEAVASRIKPVGELAIAGPKVLMKGDQVFASLCTTCHTPGVANAPKFGDKAQWAPIIGRGQAQVVQAAIAGTNKGMPPRGGNPDLTDEEVAGAVVHMANAVGANWKAPELKMPEAAPKQAAAPVAAGAPAVAPVAIPPPVAAAAPASAAAAPSQAAAGPGKGKAVYDTTCMVCHAAGVANAPKLGDKSAWAPRLATGIETLYSSSLKGKNAMPPKGGNVALPDADVKAAVDYMVAQAK